MDQPGDPRQIDPAGVEQDEEDVAARDGSSTPEQDAEEAGAQSPGGRPDDADRALEAMPREAATEDDQVTQRTPDTDG